jgi:large subunit ribosomal protein L15
MATRLRKSRKQRGSRYCGWGQIGQHRASGSRGGVGGAGKHKHFWMRTVKEEPDHFGHHSFRSLYANFDRKWLNIRDLDGLFLKFATTDESGKVVLNLTSLGFDKLLGGGNLKGAFTIKVPKVSSSAKSKIEAVGGEIILDE